MAAKRRTYKEIAERVTVAVTEVNAALVEAYEHPQVRVYMGPHSGSDAPPLQLGCEVTRVTKHKVIPERDAVEMAWVPYRTTWRAATKEAVRTRRTKAKREQ